MVGKASAVAMDVGLAAVQGLVEVANGLGFREIGPVNPLGVPWESPPLLQKATRRGAYLVKRTYLDKKKKKGKNG